MTVIILKMSESSAPVVCNSIKHKWYISIVPFRGGSRGGGGGGAEGAQAPP